MNVFELFGKIVVDNSGAEKGIDNTVKHAKDAESSLAKTFKKVGSMVAAAFSVRAVVDFGKQCTQAYATIAAEESAFAQIMGDYADTAQEKLNAVSDATGVSATRMTSAMTSLTAKFKGLGYNVQDATTLATDGLLIASDAAAFWDMSLDESMSHLNSFINGSYEGGEAIGLFANDTQMAAYAVEQGIVKDANAWSKLDEAIKQATRLDYAKSMMEQSGATGQALKEADSYANVMANLKESWRQFQGIIGKPILEKYVLPAMQKLNEFMPNLTESVQNGIEWLGEGFDKIKGYFEEVFTEDGINMDALPDALSNMFRDLGRSVGGLLNSFGQTLRNGWVNIIWPMTQKAFKATFGIDLPEWSDIESIVVEWWGDGSGISKAIAGVCNWTLNLFGAPAEVSADDVSSVLSTWWENTKAFVQKACEWTLALFNQPLSVTLDNVKTVLSTWWSNTKGLVQQACNWALDLFGAPEGTTKEKVDAVLSTWWSSVTGWVANACNWVLNLFGAPAEVSADDVSTVLSTWWTKTKQSVQSACSWVLALFNQPLSVTIDDVKTVLSTWWADTKVFVQQACAWTLGLFAPPEEGTGENSAVGIISKWWSGIQASIEEVCQIDFSTLNIKGSLADLLGVGAEVVTGIKDGMIELFDWFLQNDTHLSSVLWSVAGAFAVIALSNPAITAITALTGLIGAMKVDWENFEENYPDLVDMFEKLTGMDFTVVAESMGTFKGELQNILTWFAENEAVFNSMLVLLGGVATSTGHPVLGAALIGYGASEMYSDLVEDWKADYYGYRETAGQGDIQSALVNAADVLDKYGRWSTASAVANYIERLNNGEVGPYKQKSEENALVEYLKQERSKAEANGEAEFAAALAEVLAQLEPLVAERNKETPRFPVQEGENRKDSSSADWFNYKDVNTGGSALSGNLIGTLMQQLSNLKSDLITATQEGVASGVGNITITANVTAGDVNLDGKTVGAMTAPYVDLQLGMLGKLRG